LRALLLLMPVTMENKFRQEVIMEDKGIYDIVRNSGDGGRTITEIVASSKLPRSVVRILLARLEGADKVSFRKVGMAKIYRVMG